MQHTLVSILTALESGFCGLTFCFGEDCKRIPWVKWYYDAWFAQSQREASAVERAWLRIMSWVHTASKSTCRRHLTLHKVDTIRDNDSTFHQARWVKLTKLLRRGDLLPVTDAALHSDSLDVDDLNSGVGVQRVGLVLVVKNFDSTGGKRHVGPFDGKKKSVERKKKREQQVKTRCTFFFWKRIAPNEPSVHHRVGVAWSGHWHFWIPWWQRSNACI